MIDHGQFFPGEASGPIDTVTQHGQQPRASRLVPKSLANRVEPVQIACRLVPQHLEDPEAPRGLLDQIHLPVMTIREAADAGVPTRFAQKGRPRRRFGRLIRRAHSGAPSTLPSGGCARGTP